MRAPLLALAAMGCDAGSIGLAIPRVVNATSAIVGAAPRDSYDAYPAIVAIDLASTEGVDALAELATSSGTRVDVYYSSCSLISRGLTPGLHPHAPYGGDLELTPCAYSIVILPNLSGDDWFEQLAPPDAALRFHVEKLSTRCPHPLELEVCF